MTSEHLNYSVEKRIQRTPQLDLAASIAISRVDASRRAKEADGVERYHGNWRDYIALFVDRAYREGVSLSEEEATIYIKEYLNNPSRESSLQREEDALDLGEQYNSDFMDRVHKIAQERLSEPETVNDENERGENNE